MGCNCKATEKILKIHKKYGNKINISWKEQMNFKVEQMLKFILIFLVTVAFAPIIFIIITIMFIKGNTVIDLNKILKRLVNK